MKNKLLALLVSSILLTNIQAQNVGIGTNNPTTKLHIAGAIASTPTTAAAAAAVTIPDNSSIFRLSATAGTQANVLSLTNPTDGQMLTIYNEDGDPATFASQTIAATSGIATFEYINGGWRFVSNNQSSGGGSYINNATTQQVGSNFNIDGNGLMSAAGSQAAIGTGTVSSANGGYELTLSPNATKSSGISISMSSPSTTAYGLNISASSVSINGILASNSTSSTSSSVYNIGAVLSSTNIVSGYNAYRNGSGLSYGLYGINGTNSTYATNANTWAAFLQGRTVISSESAPTSTVGTDLEVRNTTTGASAPATVALRQTTALATSGNILGNLNFGDNYVTTPQAQIQVLRDNAASSTSDMPTAMTFSTTPDASATLTERMRIANNGWVGVNTTPATMFHVTSAVTGSSYFVANNATIYTENTASGGTTLVAKNSAASSTGDGDAIEATTAQSGAFGIWGQNTNASGAGIVGAGGGAGSNYTAGSGGSFSGPGAGVVGFGGTTATGVGVTGLGNAITTTSTLAAGSGGTMIGVTTGLYAYNTSLGTSQAIYSNNGGTICRVNYWNGATQYKINGTGTVSTVTKDINGQSVTLHCTETPEIYFQDYGEGQLVNGRTHIDLDPSFAKNIAVNGRHPLRAFIQLNGDCKGVYTMNETQNGFDVEELQGGVSNVKFHWTVVANRADELLDNGRLSHNADMRFEPAGKPEPTTEVKASVRSEKKSK